MQYNTCNYVLIQTPAFIYARIGYMTAYRDDNNCTRYASKSLHVMDALILLDQTGRATSVLCRGSEQLQGSKPEPHPFQVCASPSSTGAA